MPPRLNEASSLVAHGPVLLDYYTIRGSLFVKVRKSGVFPGKTGKIGDFPKGGPVPQPSSTVIGRPPGSSVFQRGQLFPCLALGVGGEEEAPGGAVDLVMIVNIADLVHGVPPVFSFVLDTGYQLSCPIKRTAVSFRKKNARRACTARRARKAAFTAGGGAGPPAPCTGRRPRPWWPGTPRPRR